MKVLQINTTDHGGGAAAVAWSLLEGYSRRGCKSELAVGEKVSNDPRVWEFPRVPPVPKSYARWLWYIRGLLDPFEKRLRGVVRARELLRAMANGPEETAKVRGREDYDFPGSRVLLDLPPPVPAIIQAHNFHGGYFDLRVLPKLSSNNPLVVTLHDAWLLGGHCAHSIDCDRWQTGCGKCPYLYVDRALMRDGTAYNIRRKKAILSRSRLYVATPCHWLMDKVKRSIMAESVLEARVIPNGVDVSLFTPGNREGAKARLGLSPDVQVVLFVACGMSTNCFKDYETLRKAMMGLAGRLSDRKLVFLALGEAAPVERIGNLEVRGLPYEGRRDAVANIYRAADIYVHAAKAETSPLSVLEAMSSGIPVVGTSVGGIPEQIDDGKTGLLVNMGDSRELETKIELLLKNDDLRRVMAAQAVEIVNKKFNIEQQIDNYLAWFQSITNARAGN
jgi:glycosyltransferase involved in cell wall biosynthesis